MVLISGVGIIHYLKAPLLHSPHESRAGHLFVALTSDDVGVSFIKKKKTYSDRDVIPSPDWEV